MPNADFCHENAFGAVPFFRKRIQRMRELVVEFGEGSNCILGWHGSRMQLLKAAAFVPEVKDAIVECFRTAGRMRFA